jgi:hypothetical protein
VECSSASLTRYDSLAVYSISALMTNLPNGYPEATRTAGRAAPE